MIDSFKDYKIYSQAVTYLKNKEIIFSKGESKALLNEIIISGDTFTYNKKENIFNVKKNVKILRKISSKIICPENKKLKRQIHYTKNFRVC